MSRAIKRIEDLALALCALIFAVPLMLVTSVAIFFKMGRPVLFRQIRPGLGGKPFTLYKFRSMNDSYDQDGVSLSDDQRITHLGKFIRRTSLDELPQLFNVLKGDMSIVGPRPLLMEYLTLYDSKQARRNLVKPGITGLAQVMGRNAIRWNAKFRLDVWYVDHLSLWLDMKILWMTIVKVVNREGISAPGEVSMPKFGGNPK